MNTNPAVTVDAETLRTLAMCAAEHGTEAEALAAERALAAIEAAERTIARRAEIAAQDATRKRRQQKAMALLTRARNALQRAGVPYMGQTAMSWGSVRKPHVGGSATPEAATIHLYFGHPARPVLDALRAAGLPAREDRDGRIVIPVEEPDG